MVDRSSVAVRVVRVLIALVVLAAIIQNTVNSVTGAEGASTPAQLFSMFTIQSNLMLVIVFVVGALHGARLPVWWDDVRGAVTFYLVMTGLVYAFVVAPIDELFRWDVGWTNLVLHRVSPVVVVLDWILVHMARRPGWLRPVAWLAYPVAYLAYTWIRGAIVQWYPYGFLDPRPPGGWSQALTMTGIVLVAFLVFAALVHLIGVVRARR